MDESRRIDWLADRDLGNRRKILFAREIYKKYIPDGHHSIMLQLYGPPSVFLFLRHKKNLYCRNFITGFVASQKELWRQRFL